MSPEQFRRLGHRVVDLLADYHATLRERSVAPVRPDGSPHQPGDLLHRLPDRPPEHAMDAAHDGWDELLREVQQQILPALTHWQHPGFGAYFPCNASGPGVLGELLSAGLNINAMLWTTSPGATELETRMLDWMAHAYRLPDCFLSTSARGGGCVQGTASEATLVALLAARQRARAAGVDDRAMTLYTSTQAHSSVVKAAMIAGLARAPEDTARLRLVGTTPDLALDPTALDRAVREDRAAGHTPVFVAATVGTTSTGAVDPVPEIVRVVREDGRWETPWVHVDAAWAGAALVCEEYASWGVGLEHADSLCINPHKWGLVNFDCDLFWTRDRASLIEALSITPEYLRNDATEAGAVIDYRDWQVPLGRRFRALKLWFVLRHYGLEGLRAHVRHGVALAERLEAHARDDERFEQPVPRSLNLVCLALRGRSRADHELVLREVNSSGEVLLSHAVVPIAGEDRYLLRCCFGAPGADEATVDRAWSLLRQAADRLSA